MPGDKRQNVAMVGTIFAATLLIINGFFQALMGIEAIVRGGFFVSVNNYLYSLNTAAWGWVHLGLGALLAVCGVFLYLGAGWAAVTGIVLAGLSILDNFLFLPHYPIWSILTIAIGVFVIWSLATMINARSGAYREAWEAEQLGESKWPPANQPAGTPRHAATEASEPTQPATSQTTPPSGEPGRQP